MAGAGGAQRDMEALLTEAGFEMEQGFTCKWKAQPEDLAAARQLGYEFAKKLQKITIKQTVFAVCFIVISAVVHR